MKTIFVNGLSGKMGKTINNLILDMEEAGMRNLLKNKQSKQQR